MPLQFFRKLWNQILSDIKGVLIYQDDICVFANNEESLKKRLDAVHNRLKEKNVSLNMKKCTQFRDEISFLGYRVSSRGIEPDSSLIDRITSIPPPKTKAELERFLGMANYFGRMIPHFAQTCAPLNSLRKKGMSFKWSFEQQAAFDHLKKALTSPPILQKYDADKELTLTTDASKYAIGGILTQEGNPVLYVSRSLSKAEQNYSNIERESLAFVWSILRLKLFLLGRPFTVVTDHQPLIHIFGKNEIPDGSSARIAKWATLLLPYDFKVTYSPGALIPHADAMSRLPIQNTEVDYPKVKSINAVFFDVPIIPADDIRFELKNDAFCQTLVHRIKSGKWSDSS